MNNPHWLLPARTIETYADHRAALSGSALETARDMEPGAVLQVLRQSGLRGRGGAGFPTGVKWTSIHRHPCPTRCVVMNAAEGEPGTFKDRFLLRKNPYAPLEGMLVAARVVGARQCFIGLKAQFEPEIAAVRGALEDMRTAGVLGDVEVQVVEGPDEYLFGEEKALLNVIEGEGPFPRALEEPPYEVGLFATPTSPNPAIVNNVETFAHAATVVAHGAESFRALGTDDTPGTILVTLTGDIARPGVYEVEAGTPVGEILETYGQGPRSSRTFRALLSGVSAGLLPAERFDTPADFGSMQLAGAGLGSAGFMVFDDATNMARVTQALARFLYVESCNQCFACHSGLEIASQACENVFDPSDDRPRRDPIERITAGAGIAPQGNRCYLPVQGSQLLPSLAQAYAEEIRGSGGPGDDSVPWPLPKIVDYDEATHTFTYDQWQPVKQPDWSYPEPAAEPPRWRPAEPQGPAPVHLPAALATRLRAAARSRNTDLDDLAVEVLSQWVDKQP